MPHILTRCYYIHKIYNINLEIENLLQNKFRKTHRFILKNGNHSIVVITQ